MTKDTTQDDDASATAMGSVSLSSGSVMVEVVLVHPLTTEIGEARFRAIGEIMVLWAQAVWRIEGIVCRILDIGRKEARIAAGERELPVDRSIDRVRDLMKAKRLEPPVVTGLKTLLKQCETSRNLVAHGVWLTDADTGKIGIQDVRGDWPKEKGKSTQPKRINPQLRFLDEENFFAKTATDITTAIAELKKLEEAVAATLEENEQRDPLQKANDVLVEQFDPRRGQGDD